jgi:hypothetical protein
MDENKFDGGYVGQIADNEDFAKLCGCRCGCIVTNDQIDKLIQGMSSSDTNLTISISVSGSLCRDKLEEIKLKLKEAVEKHIKGKI